MFVLRVKSSDQHFNTYPHQSINQSRSRRRSPRREKFYFIIQPLPTTDQSVKTFTFVGKPWPWIIRRVTCPPSNHQPCLMHAIKVEVLAVSIAITYYTKVTYFNNRYTDSPTNLKQEPIPDQKSSNFGYVHQKS